MRFRSFILYVSLSYLLVQCDTEKDSKKYQIPQMHELIVGFGEQLSKANAFKDVLLAHLKVKGHEWELELVNSYPDSIRNVNCDTTINGYRVIFIGEKIEGYSGSYLTKRLPPDMLDANRRRLAMYLESTYWLIKFKNGKIVFLEPADKIRMYVPDLVTDVRK